jgi:hypothetical protein
MRVNPNWATKCFMPSAPESCASEPNYVTGNIIRPCQTTSRGNTASDDETNIYLCRYVYLYVRIYICTYMHLYLSVCIALRTPYVYKCVLLRSVCANVQGNLEGREMLFANLISGSVVPLALLPKNSTTAAFSDSTYSRRSLRPKSSS